ncbi:PD-(D/E)XK nuclease family protein [Streptomyces sp. NPDC050842]|uniref:PD-(D/E)XK nuclease family protein n=1 Tax=Streptomyces sp. NPDC050842 TaxID=3365636 RepID=UPI0037B8D806
MTLQLPLPRTDGDIRLIRTSLPLLREDPRDCPRGTAVRARPFIEQVPERPRRKPVEDFALAPVMKALDAIEYNGADVETALRQLASNRRYHAAHLHWASEAVRGYLAARKAAEAERQTLKRLATVPVREQWASIRQLELPDSRGATRYERTAWGRRYASDDGSERELWLLSVNTFKENRPHAEIAEAASVAATGTPSDSAFRDIHRPAPGSTTHPDRVRIISVGCGDGSYAVLADWDAEETAHQYATHAKPVLGRIVADDRLNPGSSCERCEALAGCAKPARTPGLLGVPAPHLTRKRRSVSASDLRTHARCPALFHLTRVLHLKSSEPESEPIRRGRAVDAWLNQQHSKGSCYGVSLPESLPSLATGEQAPALAMLAEHLRACPLEGLGTAEQVEVQKRLTTYDPELDTVIVADPDLLYTRSGGWIWHETKTATRRPWEGQELLETHPQLALAVLLMSAGVPGGDPRRSLIELEFLYEGGSRCEEIDPGDPDTLAAARRIVARLAGPWAVDETYEPKTGEHCGNCEMLRHCAAGQAHAKAE